MIKYSDYHSVVNWTLCQRLIDIEERYQKWLDQGAPSKLPPYGRANRLEQHFISQEYLEEKHAVLKLMKEHRVTGQAQATMLEPYSVLGLKKGASAKQIADAYKQLGSKAAESVLEWRAAMKKLQLSGGPIDKGIYLKHYMDHMLALEEDHLKVIEAAYKTLSAQKPYDPNSLWEKCKAVGNFVWNWFWSS